MRFLRRELMTDMYWLHIRNIYVNPDFFVHFFLESFERSLSSLDMSCREGIVSITESCILSFYHEDFSLLIADDAEDGGVESWLAHTNLSFLIINRGTFVTIKYQKS